MIASGMVSGPKQSAHILCSPCKKKIIGIVLFLYNSIRLNPRDRCLCRVARIVSMALIVRTISEVRITSIVLVVGAIGVVFVVGTVDAVSSVGVGDPHCFYLGVHSIFDTSVGFLCICNVAHEFAVEEDVFVDLCG